MTKDEYIKMLYQRTEYLKSEIADFEQCNGGVEQARLWAIKEQVSRIFGLLNECDKELFPDTIRCEKEQEYIQTCNTERLVSFLLWYPNNVHGYPKPKMSIAEEEDAIREWLKQPHTFK